MAEDPRVEAAARALAERDGRLWSVMAESDREQYRDYARAALAAADEVQAPEVERLRAQVTTLSDAVVRLTAERDSAREGLDSRPYPSDLEDAEAEAERLRGDLERTEQQIHEDGGFIDRIVDLEGQVSAAEARYTALVEGVELVIHNLGFVCVEISRQDPIYPFTPDAMQARLRAILPTTTDTTPEGD